MPLRGESELMRTGIMAMDRNRGKEGVPQAPSLPSPTATMTTITRTSRASYAVRRKQWSKNELQQKMDSDAFIDGRWTNFFNYIYRKVLR